MYYTEYLYYVIVSISHAGRPSSTEGLRTRQSPHIFFEFSDNRRDSMPRDEKSNDQEALRLITLRRNQHLQYRP